MFNTRHDVTNSEVDGMVWNTEYWISQERNIIFLWNKKIIKFLNFTSKTYIFRIRHFFRVGNLKQ